jgi:hypothetical protein
VSLEVKDYIGRPSHQCPEHRGYYYFVCLQCFEQEHGSGKLPALERPPQNKRRKGGV